MKRKDIELVHITHRKLKSIVEIIFIFKATAWSGEMVVKETDKFREAIWRPYDEAPERLTAVLKYTLDRLTKGHFYSEFPKLKKKEASLEEELIKTTKTLKKNKTKSKLVKPKSDKKTKPIKKKTNKTSPENLPPQ